MVAVVRRRVVERVEAVATVELLVDLEVKVRVAVPLVDAPALDDDLCDLAPALLRRGLVRLLGRARRRLGLGGGAARGALGVLGLRDDGCCWGVGRLVSVR